MYDDLLGTMCVGGLGVLQELHSGVWIHRQRKQQKESHVMYFLIVVYSHQVIHGLHVLQM